MKLTDSPLFLVLVGSIFLSLGASVARAENGYLPCGPGSEILPAQDGGPDPQFCMEWNPEYAFRGFHCCPKKPARARRRSGCAPQRVKSSYCDEMTEEQRRYRKAIEQGRVRDLLKLIETDLGRRQEQVYCGVNNGFLAWGREIIGTEANRIVLRQPNRCVSFGTDGLVGLLEWTGRQVAQKYSSPEDSGVRLVVGDLSAPRGGCVSGRRGGRGHVSHTTGQDVDVGFLQARKGEASPVFFDRRFDPTDNLWFLKRVFSNPYACVKAVFLDRKLIRALDRVAGDDDEWKRIRPFIKHVRGHRNHFHIRVGTVPGAPGCPVDPEPDESEDAAAADSGDVLSFDARELSRLNELG